MDIGGVSRVLVATLQNPEPIGQSVVVRAWRLRTADGQTMYVRKVDRSPEESHGRLRNNWHQTHRSEPNDGAKVVPGFGPESKNVLYKEFCRQLQFILKSAGEMKPKEIGSALDLVQSQVTSWLTRAEQDGYIRQTSKKPVKFELLENSLTARLS